MNALPNPFVSAVDSAMSAEPAAAPDLSDPPVAAVVLFNSASAEAAITLPSPQPCGGSTLSNLPDCLPVGRYLADADNVSTAESVSAIFNSNLLTPNLDASPKLDCEVSSARQDRALIEIPIHPHIMLALADELADELRTINEAVLLRQFGSLR